MSADRTQPAPPPAPASAARGWLWTARGSSLLASACCLAPLLLASLGLSAAGLSAFFAPARPLFLLLAAAALAVAAIARHRAGRRCADDACAIGPRATLRGWLGFAIAALLIMLIALLPVHGARWLPATGRQAVAPHPRGGEVRIAVAGMTCAACAAAVERALAAVPGGGARRHGRLAQRPGRSRWRPKTRRRCRPCCARSPSSATMPSRSPAAAEMMVPAAQPDGRRRRRPPHLLVAGGGSAAFAAARRAVALGGRVTIVNAGLPIGGTCVNVGCVPSKALIRAADAHHRAARQAFAGIAGASRVTDFTALLGQLRELVGELRQAKYVDAIHGLDGVRVVEGRARVRSARALEVDGRILRGDAVLIATGAAPRVPAITGLGAVPYMTSESIFAVDRQPRSLLVLGGGYVAVELAQALARLGTRVTLLQRAARILPHESPALTDALADALRADGVEVVTGVTVRRVTRQADGLVATAAGDVPRAYRAEHLLVAAGRQANTGALGLQAVGVAVDAAGFVRVDEGLRTMCQGIYAAGDVIGAPMYVYTAAYEGELAAENAITGAAQARDYRALPWVVFTDPQLAGVGLDQAQACARGYAAEAVTVPLSAVPRARVARDVRGSITLVRDRASDRLLGARILAAEGGELVMEAALAIRHGLRVRQLATAFHPHLTLGEGVKLAALAFDTDLARLSCCAT
jgi:mercuric reductase